MARGHPECFGDIYNVQIYTVPVKLYGDGVVNCIAAMLATGQAAHGRWLWPLDDSGLTPDTYQVEVSLYDLHAYATMLHMPSIVVVGGSCDTSTREEFVELYFKRPDAEPLRYH